MIISSRLSARDIIHGINHHLRLQPGLQLSRIPVLHPEIIQMPDIGSQLNNCPVDISVPLIIIFIAEVALNFRHECIPDLKFAHHLHRYRFSDLRDIILQINLLNLSGGLQLSDRLRHSLQPFFQILHRSGIRDPDVIIRSESIAGHNGYSRFFQKVISQPVGIPDLYPASLFPV